jgi:hypothetical protein
MIRNEDKLSQEDVRTDSAYVNCFNISSNVFFQVLNVRYRTHSVSGVRFIRVGTFL